MTIWLRKDKPKLEIVEKHWYPVFHRVQATIPGFLGERTTYETWKQLTTTYEYVVLDGGVKYYKCSTDGGVTTQFYRQQDLQFPRYDNPVETK